MKVGKRFPPHQHFCLSSSGLSPLFYCHRPYHLICTSKQCWDTRLPAFQCKEQQDWQPVWSRAYRSRANDGDTLLVCHFDELSCQGFWDALSNDGNGTDLDIEKTLWVKMCFSKGAIQMSLGDKHVGSLDNVGSHRTGAVITYSLSRSTLLTWEYCMVSTVLS